MYKLLFLVILLHCIRTATSSSDVECDEESQVCHKKESKRYLIYGVNLGEGFNLRRDVYMRVATLVRKLHESDKNLVLVLPPWGNVYHWHNRYLNQDQLLWSQFFDLKSLSRYMPVIEFEDFLRENNKIDQVFYLQNYKEGWSGGNFVEKYDLSECNEEVPYAKSDSDGVFHGYFWGYEDQMYASNFNCVSYQGMTTLMEGLLEKYSHLKSIMIDRAEVMLHEHYGQREYWNVRRSMRFAKTLVEPSKRYRAAYLNSNDIKDQTVLDEDWTKVKKQHGDALGGPYLGVHLRRGDFVRVRNKDIPTLRYAAKQIRSLLRSHNLTTVYIATDATESEYNELADFLKSFKVFRYKPSERELEVFKDGGVAIIDQLICAHAYYFIGSYESTFSYRIQEEREILGFLPERTFNRLCSEYRSKKLNEDDEKCNESSKWLIQY